MLVTERLVNEQHVITVPPSDKPTVIVQTIVSVRDNRKVRVGFEAPRQVTIHRREVQDRIDAGEPDRQAAKP